MPKAKIAHSQLGEKEIEALKQTLVEKRREVAEMYQHDVKVGQEATDDNADDFADRANNSYNRETMFALSDQERRTVIAIDDALTRIDQGEYGICTHCGEQIGKPRLEAVPWAKHCIDCQEKEEQGMLHE